MISCVCILANNRVIAEIRIGIGRSVAVCACVHVYKPPLYLCFMLYMEVIYFIFGCTVVWHILAAYILYWAACEMRVLVYVYIYI